MKKTNHSMCSAVAECIALVIGLSVGMYWQSANAEQFPAGTRKSQANSSLSKVSQTSINALSVDGDLPNSHGVDNHAPNDSAETLDSIIQRVGKLRDADVDWEWTGLGKIRPVLPSEINAIRKFYHEPRVEKELLRLLRGQETLVVGHVLLSGAVGMHCCVVRRPYGLDVNCRGLTVRVNINDGPITTKTVHYPNIREERPRLLRMWRILDERSIAEQLKRPLPNGWLGESESWLKKHLSQPAGASDRPDAKLEAAFVLLRNAGVKYSPFGIASAAKPVVDWEVMAAIKSGGRASVNRLLKLLDDDEACVVAHVTLTRLHNDADIYHRWHPLTEREPYLQELSYNSLTVEIRGLRVKDWVVTYPRFDIEKHALRHYWHSLCESRGLKPNSPLKNH